MTLMLMLGLLSFSEKEGKWGDMQWRGDVHNK
jgi:hypothetical protein